MSGNYVVVGFNRRARMWTWRVENSSGVVIARTASHWVERAGAVKAAQRAGWCVQ